MHVGVAREGAHGGHVGLSAGEFVGGEVGGVDVVAVRVVPGVVRRAARVEGEEVGDRFRSDVHTDGVDQDEAGDGSRGVAYGHLGGDPAAERGAHDEDVVQSAVAQVVQVGEGEVIDAGEPFRAVGAVPAGVHGRDGVCAEGDVPGEAGDGGRAPAAVQDQDRPAAPASDMVRDRWALCSVVMPPE